MFSVPSEMLSNVYHTNFKNVEIAESDYGKIVSFKRIYQYNHNVEYDMEHRLLFKLTFLYKNNYPNT